MLKRVGALVLCGTLVAAPAHAADAGAPRTTSGTTPGTSSQTASGTAPRTTLRVLVAVKNGPSRAATLTCDPAGGDHPAPRAACRLLRAAGGDPARLDVRPNAICTHEFRPHAVVVSGKWRGRAVSFGRVYPNACLMRSAGGAVFAL